MRWIKYLVLLIITIPVIGCNGSSDQQREQDGSVFLYQNSVDIDYGNDMCSFTGEPIETVRYGGKIVMSDGEIHKFMSVECTAGYYLNLTDKTDAESVEMVDFAHGQQFLPADELIFLRSTLRPSPNGLNLTAVDASNDKMKRYIHDAYPGEYLSWSEVLELVEAAWNLNSSAMK
jgi:hypothetical protein